MTVNVSENIWIDRIINELFTLEPDCPLYIHLTSPDNYLALKDLISNKDKNTVIGITTAKLRHYLGWHLEIPGSKFLVINQYTGRPLISTGSRLILWDYLSIIQPTGNSLILNDWDQIDIFIHSQQDGTIYPPKNPRMPSH